MTTPPPATRTAHATPAPEAPTGWRRAVVPLVRWRDRMRSNPATRGPYRAGVGIVGTIVVIVGVITVPLPGQGWLTVFLGLGILATEFAWARRLLDWGLERFKQWNTWMGRQSLFVRGLVVLATCVLVVACCWAVLVVTGVPGWVPDGWVSWVPGL